MLSFHSSKAAFSPYLPFTHHVQVFRSIDPKMPSVKCRIEAAGQNSSTHTGRIKTSLMGSAFLADISLYLVTTKICLNKLLSFHLRTLVLLNVE